MVYDKLRFVVRHGSEMNISEKFVIVLIILFMLAGESGQYDGWGG